jgi:hypothetical protein
MTLNARSEAVRRRLLRPWNFRLYLWSNLPLAACAGLSLRRLDDAGCTVALPGGWRTQNPFRSMYFAAQAMAAEMSTGAPAAVYVSAAPASVSMLVTEIRAVFLKKIVGRSTFTFEDVAGMRAAIERAASNDDAVSFVGRSTGRTADAVVAAEFDVTWSFKRRA